MAINENPEVEDKSTRYAPNHKLNDWVNTILENSDDSYADMILKTHDVTVSLIMKKLGTLDTSATATYQSTYAYVIANQGFKLTEDLKIDLGVRFNLVNPMDKLKLDREEKQYRRNRKKINWINNKTLIETMLNSGEELNGKKGLHTVTVRKSTDSDIEKDKEVLVTNFIFDLLVELNPYCSPKLNENYSVMLDEFFINLMSDIASTKEGEIYNKSKLITFVEQNRREQQELVKSLYKKMYDKVNLPLPASATKGDLVKLHIKKEPKEIRDLYKMKDMDMIRLLNRLEYLDLTNVL